MKWVNNIEIEKYLFINVIFNLQKQYPLHNFLSKFLNQTKDLTHPNHVIYSCNTKYTILVDQRVFFHCQNLLSQRLTLCERRFHEWKSNRATYTRLKINFDQFHRLSRYNLSVVNKTPCNMITCDNRRLFVEMEHKHSTKSQTDQSKHEVSSAFVAIAKFSS